MARHNVTRIKDFSVSGDGKDATFTLVTKYAGDISVAMPVECLDILKPPQKSAPKAATTVRNEKGATTSQGTLHRPKKWILGAETTKHKVVALIFDPQTEREAGFALSATSAKALADDLVKSADTVTNYKSSAVRKPNQFWSTSRGSGGDNVQSPSRFQDLSLQIEGVTRGRKATSSRTGIRPSRRVGSRGWGRDPERRAGC